MKFEPDLDFDRIGFDAAISRWFQSEMCGAYSFFK